MKTALITGVSGQDGSYLTELLLSKGYEVHGLIRSSTQFTPDKWGHLRGVMANPDFHVQFGDLTDAMGMRNLVESVQPHEIYNLAAQSHVGVSFEQPENTVAVTALGTMHLLEAIKKTDKSCRFYQASSSEQFGKVQTSPQDENTRFYPRSPYGCSKVFAHNFTVNYRESYDMFAVNGILFNHESPRRGENFVTRKITRAIGRIIAGVQSELVLGNLDARRDWGYAPDYVNAMWLMLQNDKPEDFVIGMGETHTVKQFLEIAFDVVGLSVEKYVKFDPKFMRPAEVDYLRANPAKANRVLGWRPSIDFRELITEMVKHDIALAEIEKSNLL